MSKTKTLTLSGPWHNHPDDFNIVRFRVERVTDSVEFPPGQFLENREVKELCEAKFWKVTIIPIS